LNTLERRSARRSESRPGWLDRSRTVAGAHFNRWLIPPAALAIHLSIGMAYGFSVFWLPLSKALPGVAVCGSNVSWFDELTAHCNWRLESLNLTFVLFTVVLGLAAAVWGKWVERVGPRKAAVIATLFWCGGLVLGAIAIRVHQLWLLWLGTGVLGGIGLGLGYISPISTLIRWFPDRRGMATGMAVMGFGGGAMIGAPLAVALMKHFQSANDSGVAAAFLCLAAIYAVFMLGGAFGYRLPPRGWQPAGWKAPEGSSAIHRRSVHVSTAWKTPAFWCVWGVLALNVSAGIGVLSMASPMLQEIFGGRLIGLDLGITELSAAQQAQCALIAVGFTGLLSLFNIGGRFFWAVLSDRIGRKNTFFCFFIVGIPLYAALPALSAAGQVVAFVAIVCVLMSIFGGGFALIPAYLSDLFGDEMISAIQGRVLTAWSTAGVIGPLLISSLRNHQVQQGAELAHAYDYAFYVIALLLLMGLIVNACVRPVADRHFMSEAELETYRRESRHDTAHGTDTARAPAMRPVFSATAAAVWATVCVPIAWGIWMTLQRAAILL
jgi:MFS family permease